MRIDPHSFGNIGNATKEEAQEHYKIWGKNTHMKEHENPYWNKKIPENYHDRTPAQKASSDEERHEYESRHKAGLRQDE